MVHCHSAAESLDRCVRRVWRTPISLALLAGLSGCWLQGGDGAGSASPSLSARVTASLLTPISGQEIRLDPSASQASSGSIVGYAWTFGDGRTASSTVPSVQYVSWPAPGRHTVSLTVTDSAGASQVATLAVTVLRFAPTGQLNDSGIDSCSSNLHPGPAWLNDLACLALDWTGQLWGTMQDAYVGRDAQARDGRLTKIGSGAAGFDFTRLGADGLPLAIQNGVYSDTGHEADGTRWDCVRDNTTGLIWEVKRNDPAHLRHMGHTYGWYSTDSSSNGGAAGFENNSDTSHPGTGLPAACTGVADARRCNTQSYTAAVNSLPDGQALCGFRDWRLPLLDELIGLTSYGRAGPAIDGDHFPNTGWNWVWTSSPTAYGDFGAWSVFGGTGQPFLDHKSFALTVRLVRSGQ
jgi:PKD repeat protein